MNAPAVTSRSRTRSGAARRSGYVGAMLVNGVLLFLINRWPGWAVLPFLTADMWQVLPWVNASLIAALVVNVVYLLADPAWLRSLGSAVTGAFGLAATIRMWQVFPFDFGAISFNWALLVRILLVLGIVGGAIGIVVALVGVVRGLTGGSDR